MKPKPLKKGDTIGLIATSSPIVEGRLELVEKKIKEIGLNLKIGKSCYEKYGYLSGEDSARAQDLNDMFADENIKGIFVARGGYGAHRILDLLDYETIKNNPKIFAGYSDVTALHAVFNNKCSLVTYHAPMFATELYKDDVDKYTVMYFFKELFEEYEELKIYNPQKDEVEFLYPGTAEGILMGGNLCVLVGLLGTKYEPNFKDKILFIEEIGEEPYKVDRMLMQLKLSGKLEEISGIILGDFTDCNPKYPDKSLSLMQVFEDILLPLKKPIIYNFKCGHCLPTATLPLGSKIKISSEEKFITVIK